MMLSLEIAKRGTGRRRLMLVANQLPGDGDSQVLDLARGMDSRGWDVLLVAPPASTWPDFTGTRIRTTALETRGAIPTPAAVRGFIALVRGERPDVVHSHLAPANLLTRAARPFCRIPALVCTLDGHQAGAASAVRSKALPILHRLTDRFADVTTLPSEAGASRYAGFKDGASKRVAAMPRGIQTRPYRRNVAARLRVRRELDLRHEFAWLAAGALDPLNDFATLLRTFAELRDQPGQVLLVAGDGPERDALTKLAKQLGIALQVQFLGARSDVPDLMRAADGFVLCSKSEETPLPLLEAAASRLAIAATDVGGNAEVLPPEQRPTLVPPESPRALARAMRRIVGMTDAERVDLGSSAREYVQFNYRIEVVLDRWESLYKRLLEPKPAAAAKLNVAVSKTL